MTDEASLFAKMNDDVKLFLRRLVEWDGVCAPNDLRILATRKQDRARQWAKRRGLVIFEDGYWKITDAGNAALRAQED